LVQGAQRHTHQGAFGRCPGGALPPAKIQLMSAPNPEDELAGTEQPFVAHLIELRDRLVKAMIAIGVVAGVLFLYPGPAMLYDVLAAPLVANLPKGATLIATSVISPFLVPLKILLMTAFLVALPVVLYQLWAFVAPGLYSHEKKLVLPLVVSSTLLFFAGVAFCYFFVFGRVFSFIQHFAPKSITAAPDIEAYLSFVLTMFLAFGTAFEVPIVVVVLARMGFVSIQKLKDFRAYFIVVAFIIAAVITPPDVVSQLALAIPMCLLYEAGIWAAQLFMKTTKTPEEGASSATGS
jgi:sec-independent protein translocase protein TatC